MKPDIIVSLTTWSKRIASPTLSKMLFRLLIQQETTINYKVILVLSEEEFGKNYVLPESISIWLDNPKFEILWTYENTRALKKLDPVMEKYPDIPIITTDDDILFKKNAIDRLYYAYTKYPNIIQGAMCNNFKGVLMVWGVRIFPPHSLADIPTEYFKKYFKCLQDDEWNGIRARVKGTKLKTCEYNPIEDIRYGEQNSAIQKEYNKFNFKNALRTFYKEHPEYK